MNKEFIQKIIMYFRSHRLITIVSIILFAVLTICLFTFATFDYFIHTPLKKNSSEQRFMVVNGQGLRLISTNLSKEKIISNKYMFMVYLKLSGLSGSIQAGEYNLSPSMAPITIADILSKGKVASKKVTIPEGWTISDIGSYLEKQGVATKADFEAATKKNYDYEFLKGRPEGSTLEGFLFPDTYQISVTSTADSIVKMMLDNFDRRITSDIRSLASKSSLGLYSTITLSSIVEKEANKPEDRKVVAGIFISRLNEGMRLQSDVTVAYGLGENKDKKNLTADDINAYSPYNTYVIDGLPRGPICNPGLESINAVLYPSLTDYRYFIAADDQIYYAKTLEEHNQLVQKYLR